MKRILISAIGGDVGYGVIKALKASSHDLYFVGVDVKKYNAAYDLMDEFYEAPPFSDVPKWLQFVQEIIKKCQIDIFWPITEPEMKIVDKNRDLFEQVHVVMNKSNILEIALDKAKTASFLQANGIQTPKTWDSIEYCEQKFPLIVKEAFGCGSHAVKLVNDRKELEQAVLEMQNPIIQEYVGNESDEYTLAVFTDKKTVNHIAFKRTLGLGGMSQYVELVVDEEFKNIAETIAYAFKLEGSVNIQMRKKNGKYYVFEINPRISSTIGFRYRLGFNDVSWWLDMIEGNEIFPYHSPEKNVYGIRAVEEKIFFE